MQAFCGLSSSICCRFAVPPYGLGKRLDELNAWLRDEISPSDFAYHSAPSIGTNAAAIYFRSVDDARRKFDAHPGLELADGTMRRT